jgi:hypothetical protein
LACEAGTKDLDAATVSSGDILFEDDFSSELSGWDRTSDENSSTDYSNGGYEISIYREDYTSWATTGKLFTDTDIEVEASFTAGGFDSVYGIICRHLNVDNFYVMVVGSDGYYGIFKIIDGGDFVLVGSEFTDYSDAILQGDQTNRLRFVCDNSHLSLSVNGKLLLEVSDTDLAIGEVGLLAATGETSNTTVLFDNFIVRKP